MKSSFRKKIIISIAILILATIFVEHRYGFFNYFLSTSGLKSDHLIVNGEMAILEDIVISAVFQTNDKRIINNDYYDTITIFKNCQYLNNLEPGYGKNWLIISICDTIINGPGHYKFSIWEKHDYIINITSDKNVYSIDWKIRGAYPEDGECNIPFDRCN